LKRKIFRCIPFAAAILAAGAVPLRGADGPLSPATPLTWSVRMANMEIARTGRRLWAPPTGNGGWDYTTGLYANALIRLSNATGDASYEKVAEGTIGSFVMPDGTLLGYLTRRKAAAAKPGQPSPTPTPTGGYPAVKIPYTLDELEPGPATLELYSLTHEERYRKAAEILRHQIQVQPRTPEGGFWHKAIYPNQMWLDGLYMAEPFYAAYANTFHEPADFDDIAKQFTLIGEHVYDAKTGLFYHAWDESKKQVWASRVTGASPSFWSRGMGWYAMALVDVLDEMPADHPQRPALIDLFQKVAAAALKYQDPKTGVWWQVTDQGARPHNYLESSASAMFVYALAKGITHGYLPRTDIPAVEAGYQGLLRQFITASKDGQSISMNDCCKSAGLDQRRDGSFRYYTEQEPIVSNDLKGAAPFIDAGIECQTLLGDKQFAP